MTRRSAAPLLALSLVCAACGPPLLKLPSGPGVIASDGREVLDAATAACRPLSAVSLEIAVSGSIAGSRVRGRLRTEDTLCRRRQEQSADEYTETQDPVSRVPCLVSQQSPTDSQH